MAKTTKGKYSTWHYKMLKLRGLNPKNYTVIKDTTTSLYLRDLRDGSIKIITKMR